MREKIINDPVFGFITVKAGLILELIQHPYMQRLTRIKQLGLTYYVYPGAQHTRFQHALGAMHLMSEALVVLRGKGHEVSDKEFEAATAAMLLHDLGHGPFSHALESALVEDGNHEQITSHLLEDLNNEFQEKLDMSIAMLKGTYPRAFFHQLLSSQLDMDRMDYLRRDSTFCGVIEGAVGSDRIIKMLTLHEDQIVVEEKGIYSVEKFLMARRLMYRQVYLHKTAVATEELLIGILRRAKELAAQGQALFASEHFRYFLYHNVSITTMSPGSEALKHFVALDDSDIVVSIKSWCDHSDKILSFLCKSLIFRHLPKFRFHEAPTLEEKEYECLQKSYVEKMGIREDEMKYFIFKKKFIEDLYSPGDEKINILMKNGRVCEISDISEILGGHHKGKHAHKQGYYFLPLA